MKSAASLIDSGAQLEGLVQGRVQRSLGWLLCLAFVAGCADPVEPVEPVEPEKEVIVETPAAVETVDGGFTKRVVNVSLSAGTNMSVAVHPNNEDRVISLQGSLFLLRANDSVVALGDAYYDAREPRFSPDGDNVVFQGYRNGNWDIWQINVASKKLTALTNDAYDDREPQYSPDGSAILFSSDRDGAYNIWRLHLASGQLEQVTQTVANTSSPSLSTTGLIAYAEQVGPKGHVVVQRDHTSELPEDMPPIIVLAEVGNIAAVQWGPKGDRLAYQLFGMQDGQMTATMKVVKVGKGNSPVPVADEKTNVSQPGADVFPFRASWLDKHTLVYTENGKIVKANYKDETSEVWPFTVEVELERHNYERRKRDYSVAKRVVRGLTNPQISNDGDTLYFTALGDIWQWQPSLRQARRLTDDAYADNSPSLSNDGTTLAFVSDRQGQLGLYLLHLGSGEVQPTGVHANQISAPAWSPDSTKVAYFVDVPGNPLGAQLSIWDRTTGQSSTVLKPMPAQPISWSADGLSVALTRLNTYSSRYREGVYEMVVAPIDGREAHVIAPSKHKSITYAAITPDGAMSYVEGGRLLRLELDRNLKAVEAAAPVTQELTDMPAWSSNGEYLVYLSGSQVKRLRVATGDVEDVTPQLTYSLDEPSDAYVIRAGRVFTGTTDEYLENMDIWIDRNRITKIVPQGNVDGLPIVDMLNKTVVPGLFEMHAHMGENSEQQGRVWLSYGVTTVRDPGSNPYVAKERQEAWDSGRRIGPRTHITGYLTDGNRVFYSVAEGIVSQAHLAESLRRAEELEMDFIKTYVRLPDHWQREVVNFAHGIGIPVSSHELYPAVAHGMDHVEHIGGTSRRGYQPKVSRLGYSYDDVIELLSKSGMGLTATAVLPGFAVIANEEPDWFDTPQFKTFYGEAAKQGYAMMAKRFGSAAASTAEANGKLLKALTDNDALLVTGTDSPFVPYGAGLHAEFRLYERAGIEPIDILRQATMNSAKAAGVADELGTLEVGKLADLVVVDGDPLKDIRDLDRVVMTVKNGRRYTLSELLLVQDADVGEEQAGLEQAGLEQVRPETEN